MENFFNLDNKFFQGIGKLVDMICLSILWIVLCIPVVTAGAATTAMYYTVNKVIRHSRGYLAREFFGAFKSNFKQSTIVWLILFVMYILMGMDCYIMYQYAKAGESYGSFYVVFVVLIALVTMWAIYLFPYMARFENKTKQVLKNTFFIAIANLGKTVWMFVLFLVAVIMSYIWPFTAVFTPVGFMMMQNLIIEKIFRKYMSEEDIAAEDERNMEYMN